MDEEVLYDVAGSVGRVTINRPERRNALTWDTVRLLRKAIADGRDDAAVRVVVLTGAGDRAFCAGADLGMLPASVDSGRRYGADSSAPRRPEPAAESGPDGGGGGGPADFGGLFTDLWSLGKPTVARVRGYALAGGFGLAVACDLVVAADDAVFGAPEIDVGLWPFVASVPLVRAMPPRRALELMMTGRRVGADEGERLGFVNRVVPVSELDAAVDELTGLLAAKPPGAMGRGRDSFYATTDLSAEEALVRLQPLLSEALATEEAAEGAAAFAEKRPPRWADPVT